MVGHPGFINEALYVTMYEAAAQAGSRGVSYIIVIHKMEIRRAINRAHQKASCKAAMKRIFRDQSEAEFTADQ